MSVEKSMLNLVGAKSADGLLPEDADVLDECIKVLNENRGKHLRRRAYYDDRLEPHELGMRVSKPYRRENFATGWGAKTVNMLAERSILDSFTFTGEVPEGFEAAMRENDIAGAYQMALPSMLTEGVGFWAVSRNEVDGEPPVVNYYDACTASGLWDWKRKRLRACMVVNDFARFGKSLTYVPSEIVLHLPYREIVIRKDAGGRHPHWVATYYDQPSAEPMAVPMVYQRSNARPFGRSRISRAVMGYIDAMMGELRDMRVQSDVFSIPQKFVAGLSDTQQDEFSNDLLRAYKTEIMLLSANEDGGTPTVGMFQGADMTPHIAVMDKLAALMASETCLPLATFGVAGNGYQSSDALRASTDDLVILTRAMNKANAECMCKVAKMVLAVMGNKALHELDVNEATVTAHFADPSMPSDAANADSVVKVVSAVPEFAGTEVFWEKLGYNEDERRRIMAQTAGNKHAQTVVNALFGGANADTA